MAKTKKSIQDLLDREAIRDLPLRYCDCVWRDDINGLVKLFARDGEFTMEANGKKARAVGHTNLRKLYREGLAMGPRPFIHNHVVELKKEDHAVGRCYLDLRSTKEKMNFIGAGYYQDDYVKEKGEWKFARREFFALRFDGPTVATQDPPRRAKRTVKA